MSSATTTTTTQSTQSPPPSPLIAHKRRRTELESSHSCSDSKVCAHSSCCSHSKSSSMTPAQRQQLQALLAPEASPPDDQHDPSSPSAALRNAVREALASETDEQGRAARIHQIFAQARAKAVKKVETKEGDFPGAGASRGCSHYQRKCWIKAKCCGKYYPCRRCHDENEDHEIDRHATEMVACVECGEKDQPVAKNCRACGVEFARYFCAHCKFYDDTEGKDAYHCDGCGICRVGKGLGIDNYHCNRCGSCVPIEHKDDHPCREQSLDANCPICAHYLASSTEPVVFMKCGHTMHVDCLQKHTASRYTCPICNKCLTDMSEWYRQMDERIAKDVIPPEYANKVSRVLCHDCGEKTVVPFHFAYHKCGNCGAYNTRVLEQWFDPERGGGISAPAVAARALASRSISELQHQEAT